MTQPTDEPLAEMPLTELAKLSLTERRDRISQRQLRAAQARIAELEEKLETTEWAATEAASTDPVGRRRRYLKLEQRAEQAEARIAELTEKLIVMTKLKEERTRSRNTYEADVAALRGAIVAWDDAYWAHASSTRARITLPALVASVAELRRIAGEPHPGAALAELP